jgi:hypothetical protein
MKRLIFGLVIFFILAPPLFAGEFVPKAYNQTYQLDEPMHKMASTNLVIAERRTDPRSTSDRVVTLYLYKDPGKIYIGNKTRELVYPYCEIWLKAEGEPVLLLVSFITENFGFEVYENYAAYGGHDPKFLFRSNYFPDQVYKITFP